MISVVGGCYAEQCAVPAWNHIYGSAGRAAAAISSRGAATLHTLLSTKFENDFLFSMAACEVSHQFSSVNCSITFDYLHPLAAPTIYTDGKHPDAGVLPHIRGEHILYFGMMEYVPTVHGNRVVYDPQGRALLFSKSGSTAEELVYVLNESELSGIAEVEKIDVKSIHEAALFVLKRERALAVIVKRGPLGATIFDASGSINISCFRARRVFKIGSGDIFAAAFSFFWMDGGETIANAADLASRAVACYVETQDAFIPTKEQLLKDYNQPISNPPNSVYIAAPFFSLEQRWLLEETKSLLEYFGCTVFSPFHNVGTGRSNSALAEGDLSGLIESAAVLALINDNDVGTIFEVGFAKAKKKRVVIYAEKNSPRDLTMLDGTSCLVVPDYCSAVYSAVWESCDP